MLFLDFFTDSGLRTEGEVSWCTDTGDAELAGSGPESAIERALRSGATAGGGARSLRCAWNCSWAERSEAAVLSLGVAGLPHMSGAPALADRWLAVAASRCAPCLLEKRRGAEQQAMPPRCAAGMQPPSRWQLDCWQVASV